MPRRARLVRRRRRLGAVLPTARLTLADVLRSYARSRGDALCLGDGDVRLSWHETDARDEPVRERAARDAGVERGDRVLWLGQNSFRHPGAAARVRQARRDVLPRELAAEPDELAFVIDDLEPRVVIGQRRRGRASDRGGARAVDARARRAVALARRRRRTRRRTRRSSPTPAIRRRSRARRHLRRPAAARLHRRVHRPAERGDALVARAARAGPAHGAVAGHRRALGVPQLRVRCSTSARSCRTSPRS